MRDHLSTSHPGARKCAGLVDRVPGQVPVAPDMGLDEPVDHRGIDQRAIARDAYDVGQGKSFAAVEVAGEDVVLRTAMNGDAQRPADVGQNVVGGRLRQRTDDPRRKPRLQRPLDDPANQRLPRDDPEDLGGESLGTNSRLDHDRQVSHHDGLQPINGWSGGPSEALHWVQSATAPGHPGSSPSGAGAGPVSGRSSEQEHPHVLTG